MIHRFTFHKYSFAFVLLAAVLTLAAAGTPAMAQLMSNTSPVKDKDFVAGLLKMNLASLVPQLLKQPPSNPAEAAGLRDALVDVWLPSLRDKPDAYVDAVGRLFAYQDRLFKQPEYKDYWGRACWSADFAQHLLLSALSDQYQAGDFCLLGYPNATQRRVTDLIAAHCYKMLERAEDEHYRLASILRAQPDFTTEYINTGYWNKMQDYVAVNIPYYRTWAVIYLLTQDDTGPYFKEFKDPKAQRAKLIEIATNDIANVLAEADRRQLSEDTLVMMHMAAADIALAGGKNDKALAQSEKALSYQNEQAYTQLLAMLTRAKVLQYSGKLDQVAPLIDKARRTEIAKGNPLNLVLCTDRLFSMEYQKALASSDPALRKKIMTGAFDVYVSLLGDPALGRWRNAIQQFVEARYPQQVPPGFDTSSLPPAVRFAAVRRVFDDAEAARKAGETDKAKADYDKVESMTTELLKQPDLSKNLQVETRFYMGFAQLRANKAGYAMQTFTDLADKFPDTQRGEQAIGVAVVSLGKPLYTKSKDNPTVQQLYKRALNVLFERYPGTNLAQLETYDYAAFLREQGQYADAVDAYDRVPQNHPAYINARYERLACLGAMWADGTGEQKQTLASAVLRAAKQFEDLAKSQLSQLPPQRQAEIRKDIAGSLLLQASVNLESLNQPQTAQQFIDQVAQQYSDVPDLETRIMGLRIRIYQKQGQYDKAEAALKQFMAKSPEKAGPLGLGVLQSINAEIRDDAAKPNPDTALIQKKADLAVSLADTVVIPWAKTQNPKADEMIAYELMPAEALLAAHDYDKALQRYEGIIKDVGPEAAKNVDIVQGQAEALFGLKRYEDAAKHYARIIRDRQERPAPLYDRAYWNAQMRFYQMKDTIAGGKPDKSIFQGIRQLEMIDKDLGGKPFNTELLRLRDKNAPR